MHMFFVAVNWVWFLLLMESLAATNILYVDKYRLRGRWNQAKDSVVFGTFTSGGIDHIHSNICIALLDYTYL